MKKVEELKQRIDHRKQIINDLENPGEEVTGIGIRFNSKSTSFINSEPCDFSDILQSLIPKIKSEIKVLESKIPLAEKEDAARDKELDKIESEIDGLIDSNELVKARTKLASYISKGYHEMDQKLLDLNDTITLLNTK